MTGAQLKDVLEGAADNVFNPDPYYQQGGDMIRCGGLAYTIDPAKPAGQRISDMLVLRTSQPVETNKDYAVTGWACTNEGVDGPPIWDVVEQHIARTKIVRAEPVGRVKIIGT
jgi:sulfur-oxidizing protein SoxB